jgi:GTP-binding protein
MIYLIVMKKIKNIAIIAHVDHGKTTLVDAILKQTAVFRAGTESSQGERIMDSMDLEKEKGITIRSKNASITYKDYKINIIDTPGHADFGGEVERILKMADGVLLLVDAKEGPMPQTKFVLKKALALGHKAIVVINKIDRPDAQIDEVINKTFDLFVNLGANDDQLDFPIVYASGINGTATLDIEKEGKDLIPLFDLILEKIPEPKGDKKEPLQILVLNVTYDNFKGKIAIGKIDNGIIKSGENITRINHDGAKTIGKVTNLLIFSGLERKEVDSAEAGDIVAVAGFPNIEIGDTLADLKEPVALPPVTVDKPTLRMTFKINDSPFAGKEGKFCTSRNLRERLFYELETNVSLKVEETDSADAFAISGRGELHLAILIEQMRREGYELAVSKPEVIVREMDGVKKEPYENLTVEVPEEYANSVMGTILQRKGELESMSTLPSGEQHMEFLIPTRGLLGLKSILITQTKGTAQMYHVFCDYGPYISEFKRKKHGSLISMETGKTAGYALFSLQERGVLFVGAAEQVYIGQVIGQNSRDDDMDVNPCKEKKLSNVRSKASDEAITLVNPRKITIETGIEYIGDDELMEVTPLSLRLRKKVLNAADRKKQK